jgi:1,4-alpha-glucan branching enzyme
MAKTQQKGNKGKKRVTFTLEAEQGKKVFVAGSFNNWEENKKALKWNDKIGAYQSSIMLAPGTYEYKFYVDGEWMVDPNNPEFEANELGTLNSVIHVG